MNCWSSEKPVPGYVTETGFYEFATQYLCFDNFRGHFT